MTSCASGSERVSRSGSEGQRLAEVGFAFVGVAFPRDVSEWDTGTQAKNINKSLSTLGKCVALLAASSARWGMG